MATGAAHQGTVSCILCRSTIAYSGGDPADARSHMRQQHKAFYRADFLLAACLLPAVRPSPLTSLSSRRSWT
jgi:hypothetical protein